MAFYAASSCLPRTPDAFCTAGPSTSSVASTSRHYHNDHTGHYQQSSSTRAADLLQHGLKGWRASAVNTKLVSAATEPLTPPMSTNFEARTTGYEQQQSYHRQQQQTQYHAYSNTTSTSNGTTTMTSNSSSSSSNMTLPPIAHLERHLSHPPSHLPPLTPPEDIPLAHTSRLPLPHSNQSAPLPRISPSDDFSSSSSGPSQSRERAGMEVAVLPPIQFQQYEPPTQPTQTLTPYTHTDNRQQASEKGCSSLMSAYMHNSSSSTRSPEPRPPSGKDSELANALAPPRDAPHYSIDWLDFTRTRSAHFIAEKTCEMICYLWFAPPSEKQRSEKKEKKWRNSKKARISDLAYVSSNAMDEHEDDSESSSDSEDIPTRTTSTSAPNALQLVASPTFIQFMKKLLETTQVSQSVIVLSLHYIHRLKQKNRWTPAHPGSEFRIAVTGLMMGNKFLDDNTYTNKTWSEVSGIELDEINKMEREFLSGVDFNLYVDKATYEAWLNLLKGLVLAKEKDCRRYSRSREERHRERERERKAAMTRRNATLASITNSNMNGMYGAIGPATRSFTSAAPPTAGGRENSGFTFASYDTNGHARKESYSRARSTSPRIRSSTTKNVQQQPAPPVTFNQAPPPPPQPSQPSMYAHQSHSHLPSINTTTAYLQPAAPSTAVSASSMSSYPTSSPAAQVGGKRTAETAFSPTSSGYTSAPSKRPLSMHGTSGISLRIPETNVHQQGQSLSAGPSNSSPLEGLQNFERMSLTSHASPAKDRSLAAREKSKETSRSRLRASAVPQTLSSTYSYSTESDRKNRPQNLYFYALACSPVKDEPAPPVDTSEQDRDRAESSQEERHVGYGHGQRKFRKYHQPVPPSGVPYDYADLNATTSRFYPSMPAQPMTSASTATGGTTMSPPMKHKQHSYPADEKHLKVPSSTAANGDYSAPLPHFRDDVWARPPAPASSTTAYESMNGNQAHYHHRGRRRGL
ncbi:hypothetical protein CPC08DRAFT_262103 [Agrocybe pediades]|nr:hypothetical protein CPC08DRAFT_262103 [Agrocybe pediades]